MSVPMKKSDPAYWLLEEGLSGKREIKKPEVYSENCYICTDPEFALMGLPLCKACLLCSAHVPADDCICDNGHNQEELYYKMEQEKEETYTMQNPMILSSPSIVHKKHLINYSKENNK